MQLVSIAIFLFAGAAPLPMADSASGTYQAKVEKVVDNCRSESITLSSGPLTIRDVDGGVEVKFSELPKLTGAFGKRGKLKAEGEVRKDRRATKLNLSGRVRDQGLRAVLVAEHYQGDSPICTQSWSIQASR